MDGCTRPGQPPARWQISNPMLMSGRPRPSESYSPVRGSARLFFASKMFPGRRIRLKFMGSFVVSLTRFRSTFFVGRTRDSVHCQSSVAHIDSGPRSVTTGMSIIRPFCATSSQRVRHYFASRAITHHSWVQVRWPGQFDNRGRATNKNCGLGSPRSLILDPFARLHRGHRPFSFPWVAQRAMRV